MLLFRAGFRKRVYCGIRSFLALMMLHFQPLEYSYISSITLSLFPDSFALGLVSGPALQLMLAAAKCYGSTSTT